MIRTVSGVFLVAALSAACGGDRPDRVDPVACVDLDAQPEACPSAASDTTEPPVPNDCTTLTEPFSATTTGYVATELAGFGTYEYKKAAGDLTSIYLNSCPDGPSAPLVALQYYGVDRLVAGTFEVDQRAAVNGGFVFNFTNPNGGDPVTCNDKPTGTVTVDSIDFERMVGSFDITVRCISDELIGRIPQETVFVGTFEARNVGYE